MATKESYTKNDLNGLAKWSAGRVTCEKGHRMKPHGWKVIVITPDEGTERTRLEVGMRCPCGVSTAVTSVAL